VKGFDRLVGAVTSHSKLAVLVMVLLTAGMVAGAPMVEQSSSLDQFQSDTPESEKLDYIQANFQGDADTQTAQIIVRGDDVLSKEALIETLEYQKQLREDDRIAPTLVEEDPTAGVANGVATAGMQLETAAELEATVAELEATQAALEENRTEVEQRGAELNATAERLREALDRLREDPEADVEAAFERVREDVPVELDDEDFGTFRQAASDVREAENREELEQAYQLGTRGVLQEEYEALQQRSQELESMGQRLEELGERVEQLQAELESSPDPTLDEQIEQLRSMNDSEIEAAVEAVLGDGDNGAGPLALMPTDYEPGETSAEATVLVVTQESEVESSGGGAASEETIDAQLAMRGIGENRDDDQEYLVFGAGVTADEIDASMADSLRLVSPLALLFVLLALIIAYRDLLDILLGVVGIAAVLGWTFGFMGWLDIAFNQLFVAVPVLLIGLSIDYAIHIFMRHREERNELDDAGPRGSMTVALAGVGIALVYVTATTVIGFLSNLTSPVGPIREFGVVSSFGIVAALLVFGVLIPALKVELDELLEGFGWDRTKRAFGTGGGRFSSVLAVGSTAARKAPLVVIVLALAISAAGGYGATQVDTSFSQEDFLAEQPPEWMDELPEQVRPSDYSAKANLQYVNDNFIREDSQAQILVEGDVTRADTLQRLDEARTEAAGKSVTQRLSNGDAAIRSPLSVMTQVAAENESFNATFTAADTDGDDVPDQDLEAVYDELYRVSPDRAASFVHREDGEYRALRMVVSIQGGADGSEVTASMRDVAAGLDGGGLEATATGSTVLNDIVQDQLLDTVIESLLVTLVAVVLFLMLTYRFTHGSATLGLVTLLPVALSVSWILGTMYLLGIPFNVLTGMITSLTVGLGVAYSIHISERYNQELDRRGSVWDAMNTAVTGTGGALLGSAATTVGGFGVLVFAILPPLQQFGIITGLTIVYAFLAAVFVLPSLLVVWTRFFGGAEPATDDDTPPSDDATDGEAPSPGSPAEGETEATADSPDASGPEAEDRTGGPAADGEPSATDEEVPPPVTPASPGRLVATRSVDSEVVEPGGSVGVELRVDGAHGRIVLTESFDGAGMSVTDVSPAPVEMSGRAGTLYVAWELDGEPAQVFYQASAPTNGDAAGTPRFAGQVLTGDGDVDVDGTDELRVVSDLLERVLVTGTVTDEELAAAGEQLQSGELSEAEFERVSRQWLTDGRDGASDGRDGPGDDPDRRSVEAPGAGPDGTEQAAPDDRDRPAVDAADRPAPEPGDAAQRDPPTDAVSDRSAAGSAAGDSAPDRDPGAGRGSPREDGSADARPDREAAADPRVDPDGQRADPDDQRADWSDRGDGRDGATGVGDGQPADATADVDATAGEDAEGSRAEPDSADDSSESADREGRARDRSE